MARMGLQRERREGVSEFCVSLDTGVDMDSRETLKDISKYVYYTAAAPFLCMELWCGF